MKWIGLTGGIASGKSTASIWFAKSQVAVVDADAIAHDVVKKGTPGYEDVIKMFGPQVLGVDGELDRKKLGAMVFGDRAKLLLLERIVHPLVQAEVLRQRQMHEAGGHSFAIYDVPLLYEKNLQKDFEKVIVVSTSQRLQVERMKQRDQFTDQEIQKRLAQQLPMSEKEAKADFIVRNESSLKDLNEQLKRVLTQLRTEFGQTQNSSGIAQVSAAPKLEPKGPIEKKASVRTRRRRPSKSSKPKPARKK
jgi:dephospho-CoA kinase